MGAFGSRHSNVTAGRPASRPSFVATLILAQILALLTAREAMACPSCPAARSLWALIFDASFWPNLGTISLPLIVLGLVSARLHRIGIEPVGRRPAKDGEKT
jgi:hypothetical protein